MSRVRVTVVVKGAAYEMRIACPEKNWESAPRIVARRPDNYPVPDAGESALWQGKPHASLCVDASDEDRAKLHARILRDPSGQEIEQFGRYLFAVMFGPSWADVRQLLPNETCEIEILVAPEAAFLDSLPWELMWNDNTPLIGQGHSISRIVVPAKVPAPAKIELSPRVLFVVGELDDQLRPGAEYVEILHSLGRQGANGTKIPGAALAVRSLVDADAAQIADAVQKFSPHIVHFVAHGLVNDKNEAVIRLTRREKGKDNVPDLCNAGRLLELLTPGGMPPPAVIVVNACHTAEEVGLGGARALAAELVRHGALSAIGMAGEVASSACRLFARAFYRTLAEHEPNHAGANRPCPLQLAVANGQLAARRHSTDSNDNVEWARPSLFLAAGATFTVLADGARDALVRALANVGGASRLMCGRTAAMRVYEEFIGFRGDGAKRVLAYDQSFRRETLKEVETVDSPFKLGKTTLLAQIKARALLDGYVPCLIESFSGVAARPPPHNLLYLSMRLAEVMDDMRAAFDISRRVVSNAQGLVFALKKETAKYEGEGSASFAFEIALGSVKGALTGSGIGADGVDPQSIARAIRADIQLLLEDVRKKCPKMKGVLVMLDDIHRYHDFHQHIFDFLDPNGLGTKVAPAPIVITFEDFTEEGKRVADRLGKLHGVGDFTQLAFITPFPKDAEGRSAYSQYLLTQQLCASRGKNPKQTYEDVLQSMHDDALGVPSFLKHSMGVVRFAQKKLNPSPLASVDEEAVFAALQKDA